MTDSPASAPPPEPPAASGGLAELAGLFLRLGLTAFGGPAAHVALMEAEVVRRRAWMSHERFLDLFGAASLLPGPSSSELALFIGLERAGLAGLGVAGACFILPASILTGGLAWAYVRFGTLPRVGGLLHGLKPVILAIVVQAIWSLAPRAARSRLLGAIGLGSLAASLAGVGAVGVMLGAGLLASALGRPRAQAPRLGAVLLLPAGLGGGAGPATLPGIFGFFLKVGAVIFGSGYTLLAFLRADLVDRWGWLTEAQLLDAVAVGQITPGPVFTTATFLGYLLGGVPGAVLATIGVFLPGFVLVALSRPLLARVRRSPAAGAFLDGVNVASVGLMTAVTLQLGRAALVDRPTIALAAASALLLIRWKISPGWLLAAGAATEAALVGHG